jgi:hypothetical protein
MWCRQEVLKDKEDPIPEMTWTMCEAALARGSLARVGRWCQRSQAKCHIRRFKKAVILLGRIGVIILNLKADVYDSGLDGTSFVLGRVHKAGKASPKPPSNLLHLPTPPRYHG